MSHQRPSPGPAGSVFHLRDTEACPSRQQHCLQALRTGCARRCTTLQLGAAKELRGSFLEPGPISLGVQVVRHRGRGEAEGELAAHLLVDQEGSGALVGGRQLPRDPGQAVDEDQLPAHLGPEELFPALALGVVNLDSLSSKGLGLGGNELEQATLEFWFQFRW
jgi:hypothetical protein